MARDHLLLHEWNKRHLNIERNTVLVSFKSSLKLLFKLASMGTQSNNTYLIITRDL